MGELQALVGVQGRTAPGRRGGAGVLRRLRTSRWIAGVALTAMAYSGLGLFQLGQAHARIEEQERSLAERARRSGLPAQLLANPRAYLRAEADRAKARRTEALARFPERETPDWLGAEVRRIEGLQALHTVAGLGRELREGKSPDTSTLSPAARALLGRAKASRVRLGPKAAPALRSLQRLSAPARLPRLETPASWRGSPASSRGLRPLDPRQGLQPWTRVILPLLQAPLSLLAIADPADADLQPTPDAASDDARVVEKAHALGGDPVRIFSFVRGQVATELYAGSKKGAVGTLLSLSGNDVDQASLLVALLRAAGIAARYELGTVLLSAEQANWLAGADELSVSATALSSAGIRTDFASLGAGRGMGLQIEHTWVRAWVPLAAYRGVGRPGTSHGWAHLSPSLAPTVAEDAVDLRDAAVFDEAAYLAVPRTESPVQVLEDTVRQAIEDRGIDCTTLEAATPVRRVAAGDLTLLPAELPAVRVATLATVAELPGDERHTVRIEALTSQGSGQLSYEAPMAELWGRSVAIVYEPATAEDAQIIADHGGLESTPAFLVRLRAVLAIDGAPVATGSPEPPGVEQRVRIDLGSPATGLTRHEHALVAGGVYAFGLTTGAVPAGLIAERTARAAALSGDAREAELLHVAAISYLGAVDDARRRAAGLLWHRTFTEVEETMAAVVPRVEELGGVPLSVSRDFFVVDAAGLRYGDYSVDGDHHRSPELARLVGLEGSVQEHVVGERFRGSRQYSAARLHALAREAAVPVETFDDDTVDDALAVIEWPPALEDRLRDFAHRGLTVEAPRQGHAEPVLGNLYGFFARDPRTGAGAYIVESEVGPVNGGFGENGNSNDEDGDCALCGESGDGNSRVHFASGNLTDTVTDLVLPARGLPLVLSRTYNSRATAFAGPRAMGPGWSHAFEERLLANADGSLTWVDHFGIGRPFAPDGPDSWTPPPKHFQTIERDGLGYLMRYPDGLVHRFDAAGLLVAQEDLSGHQLEVLHDAGGRVTEVTAAGGNTFVFEHDPDGRLVRVTDSAGREVGFGYDAQGRLTSETSVTGETRSYGYDASGRMTEKTDYRGNTYRMGYDDLGRVVRLEDPLGAVRTYAYDPTNGRTIYTDKLGAPMLVELNDLSQPTRIVDALGGEREMQYDAAGNKTAEQDSRGNLTVWTYDGQGNLLSTTDPLGATSSFVYGPHSRLVETTDALGRASESTYDLEGNLLSSTDAAGETTTYSYADGLPVEITRPGGAVTAIEYDTAGSVTAITDPEGGRTELGYDAAGNLTSLTDALGATRSMQVDAAGRLLSLTDPLGAVTSFTYDEDGNRTSVTDPASATTSFRYDALGRLVETEDALGALSRTEYDAEGRVTARIDAFGHRTELRYDALGRLVETVDAAGESTAMRYCADLSATPCCVIDPLGNTTTIEEDELGREVASIDPLGRRTETTYDLLGRRESATDPAGLSTIFAYDEVGRLTTVTDAMSGVTRYGFDARGNRTTVTDANGQVTRFDFDLANRLVRETTPIGTVTEYGFDLAGNRTRKLDGKGQTTSYAFDAARRLETITYDDGTTAQFTYDSRGNRTLAENQDSRRESTYDALGRLETVLDVETGRTIRYSYNLLGQRVSMTVEPDGLETTYAWESRGLLLRLTDPDGGEYRFAHDAAGRRTLATYPNGMTLAQTYSDASEILAMVYTRPSGEVLESFRYSYDARGNRTEKVFADGSAERYGYDDLSRLTSATYGTGRAVEYVFDPVGNRLEMTEAAPQGAPVCNADADCDAVPDDFDNCPAYPNAGQTDSDRAAPVGAEAYWAFDEVSGTVALDSANGHDGTLTSGPTRLAAGKHGHALRFGSQLAHVKATVPMAGAEAASIELWMRTSTSQARHLVSIPRLSGTTTGFDLGLNPGQVITCLFPSGGGGCISTPEAYADGEWHHVAATYDGADLRLYWDGEPAGVSSAPAGTLFSDHDEVNIGRLGAGGLSYQGDADEVALYRSALTAEEIAQHAAAAPPTDGLGDVCDPCPLSNDTACAPVTCLDDDGDGYGVLGASHCPGGDAAFDCTDADPAVHPGVVDTCGGADDDCDGRVDEDCVGAPRTTTYSYSAFNQLLDATDPGGTTLFTWDDNGNQTARTAPAERTEYTWDARDRLSEIALPEGTTATYGYDTDNLRVSMDDSDGARRILLDGLEESGEVDEATGELGARFDHDPTRIDALLAQATEADGRAAMLTDALGSVYGLADDAASLRARYGYDVYGARSATVEEIATRWGFTGRPRGSDLDLLYLRQRLMSPALGGFLQPDPIQAGMGGAQLGALLRLPGSQLLPTPTQMIGSQYALGLNAPTGWTDPLGLAPAPCGIPLPVLVGTAVLGATLLLSGAELELAAARFNLIAHGVLAFGVSSLLFSLGVMVASTISVEPRLAAIGLPALIVISAGLFGYIFELAESVFSNADLLIDLGGAMLGVSFASLLTRHPLGAFAASAAIILAWTVLYDWARRRNT